MKRILLPLALLFSETVCVSMHGATLRESDDITNIVTVSDYIISKKPDKAKMDSLVSTLPILTIDDVIAAVDGSMNSDKVTATVDAVYMVNNLKKGYSLDESRDGVSFTTRFPFRFPNALDVDKLKDIFSSDSEILHKTYLGKFQFMFRNSGIVPGMYDIRGLIEKNVADCPEKEAALKSFDEYSPLLAGAIAPNAELVDSDGRAHCLSDYKGKTVVVDVWATWCHNCLKKMPALLELRDAYADSDKVVFLTVSIDRRDKHELWAKMSAKYSLSGVNNLIADSDGISVFEMAYKILGVPRYIVIGPDGRLVDAFAPGPGDELKKIIDSTL